MRFCRPVKSWASISGINKRLWPLLLICFFSAGSKAAFAFDTAWHNYACDAVVKANNFTTFSKNLLYIGDWLPDCYQGIQVSLSYLDLKHNAMFSYTPGIKRAFTDLKGGYENKKMQKLSVFLHFDDINQALDSNEKFHYIFMKLLENTSQIIRDIYSQKDLKEITKQKNILITLGSSLHVVQDFYAHTNWVDKNFSEYKMGDKYGAVRAPTYFEAYKFFHSKKTQTNNFPFAIEAGIYPYPTTPPFPKTKDGVPKSHAHLNHDNILLEAPDGRKMARFHKAGSEHGSHFAAEHQQYAVASAAAASTEWIRLLSKDALVKSAIQLAGEAQTPPTIIFKDQTKLLMEGTIRTSCIAKHWDGQKPEEESQKICNKYQYSSSCSLINILSGSCAPFITPATVKSNKFFVLFHK
ncbi:MAG: hypothetical protein R8K20_02560, partial [Gallionellaceae bacterium]